MNEKRVRAYRHGLFAETVAALLLRLKGHLIIARRYKSLVGEIDLAMLKGKRRRGEAATDFRGRRLVAASASAPPHFRPRNIGSPCAQTMQATTDVVLATP